MDESSLGGSGGCSGAVDGALRRDGRLDSGTELGDGPAVHPAEVSRTSAAAPAGGGKRVTVIGYDTTGDGRLDAFDTNQDGLLDVTAWAPEPFEGGGGSEYEPAIMVLNAWHGQHGQLLQRIFANYSTAADRGSMLDESIHSEGSSGSAHGEPAVMTLNAWLAFAVDIGA